MTVEMIETASEVVDEPVNDVSGRALAECNRVEAGLATLAERFKGAVYDCRTVAGLQAAKDARLEIRETRFAVQNTVDAAKKYLNDTKRKVDERGDEIVARLKALEDPIDAQIKADEKRRAAEKEARERAEREARDALMRRLDEIRAKPFEVQGTASINIVAAALNVKSIDTASFGEFEPAAVRAISETVARLEKMAEEARAREAAEEANRAERERLAAERRAHEEQMAAERAKLAAEQAELKRQQDEAAAAERHRKEVAEAEERERRAVQERQEKAQREAKAAAEKREAEIRAAAEREMAAARQQLHDAAGLLLVALISVRDWNSEREQLPDWVADQVHQALKAAGAPPLPATVTEEAAHG